MVVTHSGLVVAIPDFQATEIYFGKYVKEKSTF